MPDREKEVLTPDQLLSIYYRSVGRGAQLLLNIPPNPRGLFDAKDVESATKFGAEVRRRFDEPVAQTAGQGDSVVLALPRAQRIDTVVLQEDTSQGERVRGYSLEGRMNGAWKPLGDGGAIGHKRIQPVTPTVVDAVRLQVIQSVATPAIRRLAVFDIGVVPPADWNAPTGMWAPDLVGDWHNYRFEVDLRKRMHEATQYRLRFVPSVGNVTELKDVVLILDGVSQPKLLKHVPGKPNELILDVTGLGDTGSISGAVVGAASGQILFGKL
jgi:alpha-L-fucosidase